MALEYSNELIFVGDREDLTSIQEYVSSRVEADEDKPRYDLTVTLVDGVVETVVEPPIPLVSDSQFATQGARLTCCVNSRHMPCLDLTNEISQLYPEVAVGLTFWADYGEHHGYAVLVAGEPMGLEDGVGVEWPEDDDTGELGDAAAREIQKQYRDAVDALLADFERSGVKAVTGVIPFAAEAADPRDATTSQKLEAGGGFGDV